MIFFLQIIGSILGENHVEEDITKDVLESRRKSSKSHLESKSDGKPAPKNDSYHLAAYCMLDALAGRDKHGITTMSTKSPFIRAAFQIQTSNVEWFVFCAAVVVHTVMAFTEDGYRTSATGLTAVCLLIYIADIVLKMIFMTPQDFFRKTWNAGQVFSFRRCK